jgi:hypothetical protein
MTTPTTLADWATHCRQQAAAWDRHTQSASNAEALELAAQHDTDAAAWRSLADLLTALTHVPAPFRTYGADSLALAAKLLAAHLPQAEETR